MKRHQFKIAGYDCRAQCQHPVRGNHGQAQEKWVYVLSRDDEDVAISLTVGSGDYPDPTQKRDIEARDLSLHIGWPTTAAELRLGDKAGQECTFLKRGRCFDADSGFTSGIGADAFFKEHFVVSAGYEQPASFWLALGDKMSDWLKSVPANIEQTHERCVACDGIGVVARKS